jgi:hypothetical protein
MARPVIWITPNGQHTTIRRELARDDYKLTDLDRLGIAELIITLARQLVDEDESVTTEHDIKVQGIPVRGLTQVDMVELGMQAFSSLRFR